MAAAAGWSPVFLLRKIDEIIVKTPMKDMLKRIISSSLLEEMDGYSDKLKHDTVLHGDLDDMEKIKHAKDKIKENKALLMSTPTNIYLEIAAEIKEIEEDLKWSKSKQGRLLLAIEEWIERAQNAIPDNSKATILIGRNVADDNPCNIIVGGYSKTMTSAEIKNLVMSLNPPVRPLFLFPKN